jgi:hypothetical protein
MADKAVDLWKNEISEAKKWFRKFHQRGDKVNRAFLAEHKDDDDLMQWVVSRLNLFHANITTMQSMLYGRSPKVEVSRRFADADDDVARVAGEILTRILNTDIEVAGEDLASVFRNCLQDRLVPGLGNARVQYQYRSEKVDEEPDEEEGQEIGAAVPSEKVTDEWTDIVYTHWKDVLWSPARTYPEIRWKAYRSYLTKQKFKKRFPKADLRYVSFSSKGALGKDKVDLDKIPENAEAEVWEIWDKNGMKVLYWTEGYPDILEENDDPLELEGFWPDPPPLIANCTTSKYLPKADYDFAKDLYREIDELESRISLLTEACKCVGVYDASNDGVQRIFNEGVENQLIPVKNWGQFSEKGGLDAAIDWVPIEQVAKTIEILTAKQNDKIQQLFQVTGMNDVMRGGAVQEGKTPVSATERKIQANYGSIRIEALQNEFARWVSDTQALKAEIIAKHYQPYCIIEQSNILSTEDGQNQELIQAAIDLIKSPEKSQWRITVRPESLAIADYDQLKQDRVEYIMGLAQYMQSAAPLLEMEPGALPTLLKLLKWGMAGFRGSTEIEGVLDQQIAKLEKQPPQSKPDPEAQKAQAEMQKMQAEMQMKQQDNQAKMQMEKEKHQLEIMQMQQEFQFKLKEMQMEFQFKMMEFQLKLKQMNAELNMKAQTAQVEAEANTQEQVAQFAFNTAEREKEMEMKEHETEMAMESGDAELARDKERAKLKSGKSDDNAGS